MLKAALLSLFSVCLIATSCNKEPETVDPPPVQQVELFTINGLHDINFNSSSTSNILPVSVLHKEGTAQERVTISVEGLPNGIWAQIDPDAGVPTFGSMITFHQSGNGPSGGTYPIKVVGTSASYKKSYDISIKVPANGFSITCADTLNLAQSLLLSVSIEKTSGNAEPVTVSVSDVPTQLQYTQTNSSGTPTFHPTVLFKEDQLLAEGYYPVKISAASASATFTKIVRLYAPVWKGFNLDGVKKRGNLTLSGSDFKVKGPNSTEEVIVWLTGASFPFADGTYTYNVGGNASGPQVNILYIPVGGSAANNYRSSMSAFSGQQLTLTISGGKRRIQVPNVTLYDVNGGSGSKTISIDAAQ